MWTWDDLHLFLAAYRSGSLTGAARALGVNQSTASRRLAALEEALGARLFDRVPGGLRPTSLAAAALGHAEAAERAAIGFAGVVAGVDARISGTVRVAVPDGIDSLLVAPMIGGLLERHPGLVLEVVASATVANLARREADLALRMVRPAGELLCRKVATLENAVWGLERHAATPLDRAPWITWDEGLDPGEAAWSARHVPPERVVLRVNRTEAKLQAARAGVGLVVLPVAIGGRVDELRRIEAPSPPPGDVWLVAHPALRDVPRVDAVWRFLADLAARLLDASPGPGHG